MEPLLTSCLYADILIAVILVLTTLYFHITKTQNFFKKRGIPYVKPAFLYGNLKDNIQGKRGLHEIYLDIYNKYPDEPFVGTFNFRYPELLIRNPELIRNILVKEFASFHDVAFFDVFDDPVVNKSPFFIKGERWKIVRTQLSSGFNLSKIKLLIPTMLHVCDLLNEYLQKEGPKNMKDGLSAHDIAYKFTSENVAQSVFGIEGQCFTNPDAEFRHIGDKLFEEGGFKIALVTMFPFLKNLLSLRVFSKKSFNFVTNMVNDVITNRDKHNIRRNDFIQHLMDMREISKQDSKKEDYSNEDIRDHLAMFYLDGYLTSGLLMGFILYELAENPDCQEKLKNEIEEVLQKHENKISYEAIQEMKYLDMVMSETQRKYPPVANTGRCCTKPFAFTKSDGGVHRMNVGDVVLIPLYAIYRDKNYYPDPETFDPERFNEENKSRILKGTFMPFGDGPRMCLGMWFAIAQVKLSIITVIRNFSLKPIEGTCYPCVMDPQQFFIMPKDGLMLQVTPRSTTT